MHLLEQQTAQESESAEMARESHQMKVNCLTLMNVLMKETDDLKQRFGKCACGWLCALL